MGEDTGKTRRETRFDLQQMLKELASEDLQRSNEKVVQSDILDLFKSRRKRDDDAQ